MPLPGPQTDAYECKADIIGYGGAAGGGKTDLACGKSLTQHKKIGIFRREGTELTGIIDRLEEILGTKDGYNGSTRIWRPRNVPVQIEFGSCPNAGDETKFQGRPKDLLVLDEAANFLESQVRFLMGWVRTVDPNQRCQTLMTFNPPTNAEGRWIVSFFGPWLDKTHPNPAQPGELRWFATIDGGDIEVESGEPFYSGEELITPLSRTFIPSRISDNPYLMGTGYMATLQGLPEPLRSQMLYGDFSAGMEDDPWQIIPTKWVDLAMERWKRRKKEGPMDSIGVDPSRGGRDKTVLAPRYGTYFDELRVFPGTEMPDGPAVAGQVIQVRKNGAVVHLDLIGVGGSVYDHLKSNNVHVVGLNGSERDANATDKTGKLRFYNDRAKFWWEFREALDPDSDNDIALPPDQGLLSDLTAPKWKLTPRGIQVESKEDIEKRIKRSTDKGDAVIYGWRNTPKRLKGGKKLNMDGVYLRNGTARKSRRKKKVFYR